MIGETGVGEAEGTFATHKEALHERLALRMSVRRISRLAWYAFKSWKSYCFRFIYHRELLLQNFVVHSYVSRRFYAWRWIARTNASLGVLMRKYWRRRCRHHFMLWKYIARWLKSKQVKYPLVLDRLKRNVVLQRHVIARWAHLRMSMAAVTVYRAFLRYRLRKLFWAMKLINRMIKTRYGMKIVRMRKHREKSRAAAEMETLNILLRRASSCLEDMMNGNGGEMIVTQYLTSVKSVIARVKAAPPGSSLAAASVFPDPKDAPEFAKLWTVRAKAMEVLKMRCIYTVTELSIRRFRLTYPPPYECDVCSKPFILKAHYVQHRLDDECDNHIHRFHFNMTHNKREEDASSLQSSGKYLVNAISRSLTASSALLSASKSENKAKKREDTAKRMPGDGDDEASVGSSGNKSSSRIAAVQTCVCWSLAEPIVGAALKPIEPYLRTAP